MKVFAVIGQFNRGLYAFGSAFESIGNATNNLAKVAELTTEAYVDEAEYERLVAKHEQDTAFAALKAKLALPAPQP